MKIKLKYKMGNFIKLWKKIFQIDDTPRKIALGYALGIFLAATPFIGIKVFIAILLSFILKWNKMAAIIGIFHVNPITGPLFYGLSFLIGKVVLGVDVSFDFFEPLSLNTFIDLVSVNFSLFKCLLIGGFIIGLPLSMIAYYLSIFYLCRIKIEKTKAI